MAWWLVPLGAFVIAVVWVSVANRPRPRAATHDSMAEHERFRRAMGRPVDEVVPGATPATPAQGATPAKDRPRGDAVGPEPGDGRPASA
jgi:hypothetical protein